MPSGPRAHPPRSTKATRRRGDEKKPRPPPHWFTLGSFRTLVERLMHPPPPADGEHYFLFVAPRYNVSLEDVIADKHLAPLSLQDFQDYLQNVEGKPENLYFHLWVQHYRRVHSAWAESVLPDIPGSSKGVYRSRDLWERLAPCQDRQLKEEFAFAKSTFFDKDASMRLGISEEMRRKVMHIANMPPQEPHELTDKIPSFPTQPEPGHFDAVLEHVDAQLGDAFKRFQRLAFLNSGLWHSCLGHFLGAVILAGGLAMWCAGVTADKGRGIIAGSLPVIWVGVWFMLVSLNGHCLAVYSTGDARQLYPHEFVRPMPPDAVPPPVYSIARPTEENPPPYASSRKASGASGTLLPFASASVPVPARSHQPWTYLNGGRRMSEAVGNWRRGSGALANGNGNGKRRQSEGLVRMFGWHTEEPERRDDLELGAVAVDSERRMQETAEMLFKLPPARKTKDLPRQSFGMEVFPPVNPPTPPAPAVTLSRRGGIAGIDLGGSEFEERRYQVSFQMDELPDSPGDFTEENDFGIIVSEAFEEDGPDPYTPVFPSHTDGASVTADSGSNPTTTDPMVPLAPAPEYLAQRRMTMPDIFAPARTANDVALEWALKEAGRAARHHDGTAGMWPWPRRLLGPMTLVHSPVVRRAHWAVTVRTALVALVVTLGMALGMVR